MTTRRRAGRTGGDGTAFEGAAHEGWAPMALHPLDPRRDETVARIVGRRETATATALEGLVDAAIRDLSRTAFQAFLRSPKLDREAMASLDATFERRVLRSGLVKTHLRRSELSRASSPSLTTMCSMVSTKGIKETPRGFEGVARNVVVEMRLTRRGFALTTSPLGLEWRQHVADRLHMRGDERGDAHKRIAVETYDGQRLIESMSLALVAEGLEGTVAVPVAGGIVRGVVDSRDRRPPDIVSFVGTSSGGISFQSGTSGRRPSLLCSRLRNPTWTGVTYLGADDVGPPGTRYAEAFAEALAAVNAAERSTVDREAGYAALKAEALTRGPELLDLSRSLGLARTEGKRGPAPRDERPWDWDHDAFWEGVGQVVSPRSRWVDMRSPPKRGSEAERRAEFLGWAEGAWRSGMGEG